MTSARWIAVGISVVATALLVAHLVWPNLTIDPFAIVLLGVAILPWLAPLFKAIELPGGLKVEFAELEKAEKLAESAGLLPPINETDKPVRKSEQVLSTTDPNLALASLRIELERRLRRIALRNGVLDQKHGIGGLLRELGQRNLLSQQQIAIVGDLLPSLNAAVHGAEVDFRAAVWANTVGQQILAALDLSDSHDAVGLLEQWKSADGAAVAEVGEQLSKLAVSSPTDFLRVLTADPAAFDAWLRGLQYHTFPVYNARDKVEDELYRAYYERLRTLMMEALSPFVNDGVLGDSAKRAVSALQQVTIRRID